MSQINASKTQEYYGAMGYTLIEIMIAMLIFSLGILALFSMQISAVKSNAKARFVSQDANWAMDRIEKLMGLPYSDANLTAGEHSIAAGNLTLVTDGIDNDSDGQIDEDGETGPISIFWTVVDDTPDVNTKSIAVTITQNIPLSSDINTTFNFIKANI